MFRNRWIPQLRALEDRTLPSTVVNVLQDTLHIRGDARGNHVQLSALGSQVSVISDRGPVQTFEGIHRIVADLGDGDDRVQAVRIPAASPTAVQQPLQLQLATGAGQDVVILDWAPGAEDSIEVELGLGDDIFDGRFKPPPDPAMPTPIALRASVQGGDGLDRITSRLRVEPTPFTPVVNFEFLADGGVGDDLMAVNTEIDPAALVGFNPQPEPPVVNVTVGLDGGAGDDLMAVNTEIDPAALVGFNPQPEPPVVNVTVGFDGGAGDDLLAVNTEIDPAALVGFNPQPEPPVVNVTVGMNGGAGNDVLDAQFASAATQQPLASVRLVLLGGDGNDTLRAHWPLAAFDVDAVADGGDGFDNGEFSPGLRFVNTEEIV
jgi:hypothetical protein